MKRYLCTQLVAKGVKALKMKEYREALMFFNEASIFAKGKLSSIINLYLGDIYCAIGNYNLAIKFLMASTKTYKFKKAFINLAFIYNEIDNYKKSAEYFHKATDIKLPNAPFNSDMNSLPVEQTQPAWEIYTDTGIRFFSRGKYELAEKYLLEALKYNSQESSIFNALGCACDLQGEYNRAQEYYLNGLSLCPDDDVILANLGVSYYLQGKLREAEENLLKSISINPAGSMYYWLYLVYKEMAEEKKAEKIYCKGVKIFRKSIKLKQHPPLFSELAKLYAEKGENLDEAEALAIRAVNVYGGYFNYFCLGKVYLAQGRIKDAAVVLKASLLDNPNYPLTSLVLGKIYKYHLKNFAEAEKYFSKVLEINKNNRFALAELYKNNEQ
ncbi:MAG: tetratricopeptide repeat protein [Elusimicrobiota bacterium]